MKYTAIFHGCKNDNFQVKKMWYFSYFYPKHRSWVHFRSASLIYQISDLQAELTVLPMCLRIRSHVISSEVSCPCHTVPVHTFEAVHDITQTCPYNILEYFTAVKMAIFRWKKCDIFHIFAQNIDRGYTLEPPHWGGSNEYPRSMF